MYRVLEALRWEVPDWIVVPGGNLGNSSAFGKAFARTARTGPDRPRAAAGGDQRRRGRTRSINWSRSAACAGTAASPTRPDRPTTTPRWTGRQRRASTIASAIEINRPVNLQKCLRALEWCDGVVREVTDQEILDAKAQVGAGGMGCEPASAASVAGAKRLVAEGVIRPDERVVCILTGHQLKDPTATVAYHAADPRTVRQGAGQPRRQPAAFANRAVAVPNDLEKIIKAIRTNE